ncbi:hypothetical protein AK812_SmicGene16157 [Symbiodinium microadriaticum]|uniref:Uncharacterized protein n=1 Tax=Symbiodinium microadriaticum TaxID=2951 RepID=A0A1Q9E136_SYMMI|nr:hypothetical protein AK812_SmicGene16157 [Symbiodinium microadriaticum]
MEALSEAVEKVDSSQKPEEQKPEEPPKLNASIDDEDDLSRRLASGLHGKQTDIFSAAMDTGHPAQSEILRQAFPHVIIPQSLADQLGKMEAFELQQLVMKAAARRDRYVHLRVADASEDLGDIIKDAKASLPHGHLLFLDGKNFGQGLCQGVPLTLLRSCWGTILESSEKNEAMVLRDNDIFITLDGRCSKMDGQYKRETAKKLKELGSSVCKRKGQINIRMLYHMRELIGQGHLNFANRARRKVKVHSQLPEPLENLYILKTRLTQLPVRSRQFIDLPGDISSRAMASVPRDDAFIADDEVSMCRVSEEDYKSLLETFGAMGKPQQGEDNGNAEPTDPNDPQDDEEQQEGDLAEPDSGHDTTLDSEGQPLWPMGASEKVNRELLNLFAVGEDGIKKRVVLDIFPGSGSMALASCRHQHRYLGLPSSPLHRDIIMESLLLHICKEMMNGVRDGFESRLRETPAAPAEEQMTETKTMDTESSAAATQQPGEMGAEAAQAEINKDEKPKKNKPDKKRKKKQTSSSYSSYGESSEEA